MRYITNFANAIRAVVAALLTANNDPAINEIRNGSVHKIEERIYIHNSFLFILFPRNRSMICIGCSVNISAAINLDREPSIWNADKMSFRFVLSAFYQHLVGSCYILKTGRNRNSERGNVKLTSLTSFEVFQENFNDSYFISFPAYDYENCEIIV